MYEINYYQTASGDKPVEAFIDGLDVKMQGKVFRQLQLLKDFGPSLGEPFSSQLVRGIFELRVKQSNNITRILYFFVRDRRIILTHGFTKKTQKTPPSEIERAKKYKSDFESRNEK